MRLWQRLVLGLLLGAVAAGHAAELPALRVVGDRVVAGDRPVRLRGINWGWWHLAGTVYSEEAMRQQAAWGANLARLALSYTDVERRDQPGEPDEAGLRQIDEVVAWGARHGVYVVLELHVAPGGQNNSTWCDGGGQRLWRDAECQRRFLAIWTTLARRYRRTPAVAAYELLNEPETRNAADSAALWDLERRAVAAIRAVDPDKIIVVTGDHYSGSRSLVDDAKLPDANLLYTCHFYDPGRLTHQTPAPGIGYPADLVVGARWLRNLKDGPGLAGTRDWVRLEERFTPPADALELALMLRSSANAGTAWFDDVRLEDDRGRVVAEATFDPGPGAWKPERPPQTAMQFDANVGHDRPGSLRVRGTPDYNGWTGPRLTVEPGRTYRLSGWVKLDQATGDTYLTVSYFAGETEHIDRAWLRQQLQPAVEFGRKHGVPVWIGEFGCSGGARPEGSQTRWVTDCLGLFEELGLHWSYWNYRETTGPTSMALQAQRPGGGGDYPVNADLLTALRAGWALNEGERPRSER